MLRFACALHAQNTQTKKASILQSLHYHLFQLAEVQFLCVPFSDRLIKCWSFLPAHIRNVVRALCCFHLLKYAACGVSDVVNDHSVMTVLLRPSVFYQHFIYSLLGLVLFFWCTVTPCHCNLCISLPRYFQKGSNFSSSFAPHSQSSAPPPPS